MEVERRYLAHKSEMEKLEHQDKYRGLLDRSPSFMLSQLVASEPGIAKAVVEENIDLVNFFMGTVGERSINYEEYCSFRIIHII